ncbi:DUF4149 domain-containing protein [Halopseudomonas laoshanensis]|jgi:hypothetical protein|uniref:DUF4149 domain-containing protein n=1 Tax=Halopseudomonas TaxID=2901189 RepID=UPI0037362E5C
MPPASGLRGGRIAWQLTLTLWVGGVWMLHFVLLPALQQFGLAPLLIDELASYLRPLMMGFAGVCAALQLLVVWAALGSQRGLARDLRAQLLVLVALGVAGFFAVAVMPSGAYLQLFAYLVVAFAGLILVLQPRPDETGR